jgi:hypothetical protein
MPHTPTHIRKQAPPAVVLLLIMFACIGIGACGNSSSKDTTTAGATMTATTAIARTTHTPSPPAPASPSGKPRQQSRAHFGTGTFRHALAAFAVCMRHNGVKLPTPDTSGTGPVFSTKGVNTASAAFKAASAKCLSVLRSAFPRPPRQAGKQ